MVLPLALEPMLPHCRKSPSHWEHRFKEGSGFAEENKEECSEGFILLSMGQPLVLSVALATAPVLCADPTYPLWDGEETIEQYAKKINLPATKRMDLGNGVALTEAEWEFACSYSSMAAISLPTDLKESRRIRFSVRSRNQRSTKSGHELDVGMKWM